MRLRRSDVHGPGWRRRRAGRGFAYYDSAGALIRDERLDRLRSLAIPPAWKDVWICPWPNGHIQATGVDAAGRRQYRYHEEWRARRDAEKHERVLEIAHQLPDVRDAVVQAIRGGGLTRERVLAAAVRLLDLGAFRVGSEQYAEDNGTYGLATLRRDHVRVRGEQVFFSYNAKGGIERELELTDKPTADVVRELLKRPEEGEELLGYWVQGPDGERVWHDVTSTEVNAYLKEISDAEITAKDFRTWNATVLMATTLAAAPEPATRTARKRVLKEAYERVSETLGNTPAVCKASYVDPRVVDRFENGDTVAHALHEAAEAPDDRTAQQVLEQAVCQLLSA
ncbi:DNA topoisomerase IB [Geodermatophilus obscurus]|uniref:DNA topoisomerase n=1 Tax=Geodermatophilus obscurus (strain ATCC 25078 / DSM 43160 / JCM 3152 / CCUG 61914 / KCC A-0152 / KCTC 9177 / NBRC 13315 / NRRL B-3577 / G-20) TaxID=526225 RepID=D2SFP5_GEOOG|nr:DNA topoisomerase IB [Geodermatophilus obscurus]ADB74800.1 DNA topoisomerase [Geodermatophilus obscurus DSM 43160]